MRVKELFLHEVRRIGESFLFYSDVTTRKEEAKVLLLGVELVSLCSRVNYREIIKYCTTDFFFEVVICRYGTYE